MIAGAAKSAGSVGATIADRLYDVAQTPVIGYRERKVKRKKNGDIVEKDESVQLRAWEIAAGAVGVGLLVAGMAVYDYVNGAGSSVMGFGSLSKLVIPTPLGGLYPI